MLEQIERERRCAQSAAGPGEVVQRFAIWPAFTRPRDRSEGRRAVALERGAQRDQVRADAAVVRLAFPPPQRAYGFGRASKRGEGEPGHVADVALRVAECALLLATHPPGVMDGGDDVRIEVTRRVVRGERGVEQTAEPQRLDQPAVDLCVARPVAEPIEEPPHRVFRAAEIDFELRVQTMRHGQIGITGEFSRSGILRCGLPNPFIVLIDRRAELLGVEPPHWTSFDPIALLVRGHARDAW